MTAAGELIEVDMREPRRDSVAAVEFAVDRIAELLSRQVAAEVGMGLYCACAAPGQSRIEHGQTRSAPRFSVTLARGCRAKGPASSLFGPLLAFFRSVTAPAVVSKPECHRPDHGQAGLMVHSIGRLTVFMNSR